MFGGTTTPPVETCATQWSGLQSEGIPGTTVTALVPVTDDEQGSILVVGYTKGTLQLGCSSLTPSEQVGFVARIGAKGECLQQVSVDVEGGTLLAADYLEATGQVIVAGQRGSTDGLPPFLAVASLANLSFTPLKLAAAGLPVVRAVRFRDAGQVVAVGNCGPFGTSRLYLEIADPTDTSTGVQLDCTLFPAMLYPADLVARPDRVYIAGGYTGVLPGLPLQSEEFGQGVYVAEVLDGGGTTYAPVSDVVSVGAGDNDARKVVHLAWRDDRLAVAARTKADGTKLGVVELDPATLSAGATVEVATGCASAYASDLVAGPEGWYVGGGGKASAAGCHVVARWDGKNQAEVLPLPLAGPVMGPRPQLATGCFGLAAATTSATTLYLERPMFP